MMMMMFPRWPMLVITIIIVFFHRISCIGESAVYRTVTTIRCGYITTVNLAAIHYIPTIHFPGVIPSVHLTSVHISTVDFPTRIGWHVTAVRMSCIVTRFYVSTVCCGVTTVCLVIVASLIISVVAIPSLVCVLIRTTIDDWINSATSLIVSWPVIRIGGRIRGIIRRHGSGGGRVWWRWWWRRWWCHVATRIIGSGFLVGVAWLLVVGVVSGLLLAATTTAATAAATTLILILVIIIRIIRGIRRIVGGFVIVLRVVSGR
jgi:hypothetical protein